MIRRDAEGIHRHLPVLVGRQIIRLDPRRVGGICGAQADVAAAGRTQVRDAGGEGRKFVQRIAEFVERQRLHMKLDIGALLMRIRAREGTELRRRHGQRPAPAHRIIDRHTRTVEQRLVGLVQCGDAKYLVDHTQLQMILQILANPFFVEHRRNAVFREMRGRPNARQEQQLHRAD